MPRKSSASYLGTLLTDSFNNKAEVANRLTDCIATCHRLKLFWKKANTSIKWKIQVFNAIIRSKLLYSLECIQLTPAEISKMNAFQNKSLRRILDIPSTYIDRSYTNERLYSLIREQYRCHYESFGESWRKRKCKFLGHILRCHHSDPLHQVTFSYDSVSSRTPPLLRPGRPRADWLFETYKDACQYLYGPLRVFDINDRQL